MALSSDVVYNEFRSLSHLLTHLEQSVPGRPILRHRQGQGVVDLTTSELADRARGFARGLRAAGAGPGDRVAFLLGNSADVFAFWIATELAGIVEVPVNTELRGPAMRHVLVDCEPRLIVAEPEFTDVIRECGYVGQVPTIVWTPDTAAAFARAPAIEYMDPSGDELCTIMYSSGTTGPSKGVMLSHGYFANIGRFLKIVEPDVGPEDVFYVCTPLFHVDARLMMSAALNFGAVLAFAPRFGASSFWPDVIDFEVSFFVFVGAMVAILAKTTTEDAMRGNRLRSSIGGPTPPEAYRFFEEEHGIRLMEGYGMTECNGVTWSTPNKRRRGSVGWQSGGYEVRIIDAGGRPVETGGVGEIVVRPQEPNLIALGYWRQQEATARAFKDLWFHTGDLGRFDDDGFMYFVGRAKDVIRRRGENVSCFEVETTMSAADGILECVAIGIPDEIGGEEEILLLVVPKVNHNPTAEDIARYAQAQLARFARPRYLRIIREIPHTPTGKVAKHQIPRRLDSETVDLGRFYAAETANIERKS
jgi:crotonobetaine/carnitine-CoA ligase